ncbi:unnamed protein product [Lactuca saligna]|uniref:Uncharacterized protein n=1 Tax=Lactuca saligna TaxID=75948 RepID=A0AA35Z8R3_LACSI|nr:unnamed protein product [Lactuca saligna]
MQRRTVTIKWDQLDDFIDEDDEFFESTNRLSAVVPLDMPLSEFDYDENDQDFDGSNVSFNKLSSINSVKGNQNFMINSQYDMWMVAPGSITDRRRRLLEDMGLNNDKDFTRLTTNKLNKAYTKRLVSTKPVITSLDTKIADEKPNVVSDVKKSSTPLEESKHVEQKQHESLPSAETQPQPPPQSQAPAKLHSQAHHPQSQPEPQPPQPRPAPQAHVQTQVQASNFPVLLIRSRSDGDIDTSSFNTKQRKEELIGSISKQRLTRTSSELVTPSVGLPCQYANVVRVFTPGRTKKSSVAKAKNKDNTNNATTNTQLDSFFLIKNLDTGKEFVVKETNEEGWNKVSDLQTGKQLTMDEFEKTVGHSPMVKELMRRTSRKKNGNVTGKLASTNSLISKSFRNSKKKGAAILKTIKSSVKGSKVEKEKDDNVATKTTTTTTNNTSSSSSKTSGEQKTSGQPKTSGELKPSGEQQKTSGELKTSREQQKTSGELQKTSGDQQQKATVEHEKTGGGQPKPSGEQKTVGGQKKCTCVEQKASTDKNSNSEWVKARAHGKPVKEFSALHLCQEIQLAHDGSIWTMRFSSDGQYLATAGEDTVINIWEVQECDVMSMRLEDVDKGSITPDNRPPLPDSSPMPADKKKKSKNSKKKGVPDYAKVPETMFGLSDIPICTLEGHKDDVLDLSWSKSQLLLSSSMDKTVRLWDMATKKCLKQFTHSDYVTCIHFNPADDNYFISGSLDTKVRMWSIPSRKVVDWSDVHDMITAVCYYPDGQGAVVGLHNGDCKAYCTADCKLEQKDQIELHTKAKADPKKITGFQFSPSNQSEVLVTSADSRIRILEGSHVVNKLIGYRNTSSQFLAQYSSDGKYIICASEDSQVFIWKHEKPKSSGGAKSKYVTTTSYEHFPCTEVTVVVPWSGSSKLQRLDNEPQSTRHSKRLGPDPQKSEDNVQAKKSSQLPPVPKNSTEKGTNSTVDNSEQPSRNESSIGVSDSGDTSSRLDGGNNNTAQSTAWGLVIVTAGVGGEIKVYQNVGLPVKVGTNLF